MKFISNAAFNDMIKRLNEIGDKFTEKNAEIAKLRAENERLRQQNADMASWINAQQEGV